jgi:hypothetical protein
MALDFPASPTVGQKYPSPAVSGVPVYSWDGEKWTTLGGAIGSTGASDAIPAPDTTAGAAGSSTLWSRGDHSHPALTAPYVRYDASQSLTAPQQQQARQNIYAAPFDAMAYSGLQINGGMEVSQELGTTGRTTAGYVCDGWFFNFSGTMAMGAAQSSSGAQFPGFPFCIYANVATAQASLGAGDYVFFQQLVEGYRIARLQWGTVNAQSITLCFWSSHHRIGLYSGSIRNAAINRNYVFTYTQAAADVAQYNIINIPGDTTGTWNTNNTAGLNICFAVAMGSTNTAPAANVWTAGSYAAAPGQINAVAATSDIFRITGVTILPGNEAPSAARSPFVMRPYDQELLTCQRYFEWVPFSIYFQAMGASEGLYVPIRFAVEKRAAPTLGAIGSDPNAGGGSGANNNTNVGTSASIHGCAVALTSVAAGASYVFNFRFSASARL